LRGHGTDEAFETEFSQEKIDVIIEWVKGTN